MKFSLNNRFIVEPYGSDREIKAQETSGFAMIQQKINIKALKLLVPVQMENFSKTIAVDGFSQSAPMMIPKGALVYVKEALLFSQPWAKQIYEADGVGKFIIIDQQFVEFIDIVEGQKV